MSASTTYAWWWPICERRTGYGRRRRRGLHVPVWWRGKAPSPHNLPLYALGGGIPDQFVDLQAEPRGNVVGEDPLRQLLRIKEAVRGISRARGNLFERGG